MWEWHNKEKSRAFSAVYSECCKHKWTVEEWRNNGSGWSGRDYSLRKISKRGKISKAKHNICFWPISISTNSFEIRVTAKAWNKEHAAIEVKTDIDRSEIAAYFQEKAEGMDEQIKYYTWNFGETSETTLESKRIKAHFEKVANMILAEA